MLTFLESSIKSCDATENLENNDISPVDCWGGGGAHDDGMAQKPTLATVPMRVLTRGNPQWIRLKSVLGSKSAGSLQVIGPLLALLHRSN